MKSIKFVNLYEQNCNSYLTACEDKKTVTLIRKPPRSEPPETLPTGAEWKVKWVKDINGTFTGKCRLHSIYKKVLVVRRVGEGHVNLRVYQDRLPVRENTISDWNLSVCTQPNFQVVHAQIDVEYEYQTYFLCGPKNIMCNYDKFICPALEPLGSTCKSRAHNWVLHHVASAEKPKEKNVAKGSSSVSDSNPITNTSNKEANSIVVGSQPIIRNGQVSQLSSLAGWQVGQVVFNYVIPGVGGGGGSGSYFNYNSGQNINGSGTQTNGDVSVHNEIGTTKDLSIQFINSKLL